MPPTQNPHEFIYAEPPGVPAQSGGKGGHDPVGTPPYDAVQIVDPSQHMYCP